MSSAAYDFADYAGQRMLPERDRRWCALVSEEIGSAPHRPVPRYATKRVLRHSSQYHGVTYRGDCRLHPWHAQTVDGNCGSHETEIEAAKACDKLSWEKHHDLSRLNFPGDVI